MCKSTTDEQNTFCKHSYRKGIEKALEMIESQQRFNIFNGIEENESDGLYYDADNLLNEMDKLIKTCDEQ